ncbi:cation:proton antiporter [Uliginosibacterium sp. H1]|uniref:cation:proton antiporter n=1 Tax=Uliginosibacterium sp. H1 TaxID=3114757 RepID=UPI002E1706E8|nr:cation:proton antiporter [Uliginosibacterium sp. H1]
MTEYFFLPAWPPVFGNLLWFGVTLLVAVLLGELAHRLRLPRITGYVFTGLLLSPQLGGQWAPDIFERLRPFFTVAFGLLLFELGQRIDLGWLRRNPWLLATGVAEAGLAFVLTASLLYFIDVPGPVAVLAAALACATGPAVVLSVCKDAAARGPITERLHMLAALNSAMSFVAVGIVYAWQHMTDASRLEISLLHPLYLIAGSVVLGGLLALAVLALLARLRPAHGTQTIGAIALIIAAVALADTLQLSVVITLLVGGTLARAWDRQRRLQPMDFGLIGRLALIVVFVSTGSLLQLDAVGAAMVPAVALIAARALGKIIGVFAFAYPSGLSQRKASLLSIGLLPMTGAALLWVERTIQVWPELGAQLAAIVLTALIIMEVLAPPALQFALKRADETNPER